MGFQESVGLVAIANTKEHLQREASGVAVLHALEFCARRAFRCLLEAQSHPIWRCLGAHCFSTVFYHVFWFYSSGHGRQTKAWRGLIPHCASAEKDSARRRLDW